MFDRTRIRDNLREGAFLLAGIALVYLLITLVTYSAQDPSFSSTGGGGRVHNSGGAFGAHLSSLLFELVGRSAYLLCFIVFVFCWALLCDPGKRDGGGGGSGITQVNSVAWWLSLSGLLLFMISSSSLEYLRFHYNDGLPAGAGGLAGKTVAPRMEEWFGAPGASLMLLGVWLLSLSLTSGLSWFAFLEKVGRVTEKLTLWLFRTVIGISPSGTSSTSSVAVAGPKIAAAKTAPGGSGFIIPDSLKKRCRRSGEEEEEAAAASAAEGKDGGGKSGGGAEAGEAGAAGGKARIRLPDLTLLDQSPHSSEVDEQTISRTSQLIEQSLADFNIKAVVAAAHPGPVITRYDIQPATGVKGAQISGLARDLARALSVDAIRVLENISGTNYIGLEIPNPNRIAVTLSNVLSSPEYRASRAALPLALGRTAAGDAAVTDLAAMPHLLVAGATGAGKSVFINALLLSLLYARTPAQLRLLLIDPKMLELSAYADIPHLLAPVVTDMAIAPAALQWAVGEMESRYRRMAQAGVRHIQSYNAAAEAGNLKDEDGARLPPLPYLAIIIDELADLMMVAGKKIEISISRLAQKARAAGIHIVLATQRPSVDVITGLIKANIPCRLSFQVASKIDSRTILDQMGAEALLGKGDMLFLPSGAGVPRRLHGAFVSDNEVQRVAAHVRRYSGEMAYLTDFSDIEAINAAAPEAAPGGSSYGGYGSFGSLARAGGAEVSGGGGSAGGEADGGGETDPLYDQAVAAVVESNRASISLVQRKLRIGYNRAARIVEAMEAAGVITPMNEFGVRTIK